MYLVFQRLLHCSLVRAILFISYFHVQIIYLIIDIKNLERWNDKKMLEKREESDTYLTHVCIYQHSIENPVKRWRSFQPTLWLSSAEEVVYCHLTHVHRHQHRESTEKIKELSANTVAFISCTVVSSIAELAESSFIFFTGFSMLRQYL